MNGISQSAASQYLQDLEEQMGVTLLDRSTRPLTVTEAGKLYLEMCRDMLGRARRVPGGAGALEERGGRHGSRGFDLFGWAFGNVAPGKGVLAALSAGAPRSGIFASGESLRSRGHGSSRSGPDELPGADQGGHGAAVAAGADGGGGVAVSSVGGEDPRCGRRIWTGWISSASTKTCRFGATSTVSCASITCT